MIPKHLLDQMLGVIKQFTIFFLSFILQILKTSQIPLYYSLLFSTILVDTRITNCTIIASIVYNLQ